MVLQHLSLLDVKLQIRPHVLHLTGSQLAGPAPVISHGLFQGDSILIHGRKSLRVQYAADRFTAHHPISKAASLLVLKGCQAYGPLCDGSLLPDPSHCLQGREDSKGPVKLPAARHGVVMGSAHDTWLFRPAAAELPDQIAGRVLPYGKSGVSHPGFQPVLCLPVLGRKGQTGNAAVRAAPNPS